MFRLASSILPEKALQNLTAAYFKVNTWYQVGSGKFHSTQKFVEYSSMKISILPALTDNYMYLLIDETTKEAAIIDPVEPNTVLEAVESAGVNLTTILTTHHHWDHAGGNENLVKMFKSPLKVYGGDDRIGALTNKVKHGDIINIGNLRIESLFTPCHTTGHICYNVTVPSDNNGKTAVFTGDTLFLGGCGKFLEGDAIQMHKALIEILSQLPDSTDVYCGHEYATSNLNFARFIEPDNDHIKKKLDWVVAQRKENKPSVPSTIGEEKLINPFMRVCETTVQSKMKTSEAIQTMSALRSTKDSWKPPK